MDNEYVKFRHRFYFAAVRPIGWLIALRYHFRTKPRRLKKGEQYLILSNHQGMLDPVFLALSFKAPVYFVATDTIFTNKWYSKLLVHCLAPIRKKKGAVDFSCVKTMLRVAKEGGNVALFPDGNRAWCDFQFPIDKAVCKLARRMNMPILIYNFEGGYGVDPRWGKRIRRGSHVGKIAEIIGTDAIAGMSDDELLERITKGLRVIDSESGRKYKSRTRAENLEHLLFVCPKCHSMQTILSKGKYVFCTECGLKVEYTEDLKLSSDDKDFRFEKLNDWYTFEKETVASYAVKEGETIFTDENVKVIDKSSQDRPTVAEGTLKMTDRHLIVGDFCLELDKVSTSTVVGSRNLIVNTNDTSYVFSGDYRFNPIKYILFFNILCDQIIKKGGDDQYGLANRNNNRLQ